MLVSIDPAAERLLRVVQVKRLQAVEANQPAELSERRGVALGRADVVTRRDQVTRVAAASDSGVAGHPGDDRRELLERRSERGALPGGVLEQYHGLPAATIAQQADERFRDPLEARLLAARRVATWMEHDAEQPERLRAIELVAHRVHGLPPQGDAR